MQRCRIALARGCRAFMHAWPFRRIAIQSVALAETGGDLAAVELTSSSFVSKTLG
jgi:hypothetical protein